MSKREELLRIVDNMTGDEQSVAIAVLRRFDHGRRLHGALRIGGDSRCWPREQWEELVDLLFYRECSRLHAEALASNTEDYPTSPVIAGLQARVRELEGEVSRLQRRDTVPCPPPAPDPISSTIDALDAADLGLAL